jgi:hypothetical protein
MRRILVLFQQQPVGPRLPGFALESVATHFGQQTTEYLPNGWKPEIAQAMANHESARTTGLYDKRQDEVTFDEVERTYLKSVPSLNRRDLLFRAIGHSREGEGSNPEKECSCWALDVEISLRD